MKKLKIDKAAKKQLRAAWMKEAIRSLKTEIVEWEGAGETDITEIRELLTRIYGLGNPDHHNAWGGLIRTAARIGILKSTTKSTRSCSYGSHGRRVAVWKWNRDRKTISRFRRDIDARDAKAA